MLVCMDQHTTRTDYLSGAAISSNSGSSWYLPGALAESCTSGREKMCMRLERTTINRMRCFGQTAWTMCGAVVLVKHNSSCSANINGAAVSL
jgi:hypothetical protein